LGTESLDNIFGDLPNYPGSKKPKNRKEYETLGDPSANVKPTFYTMNGVRIEFYTVGQLAKLLGRRPVTVRMWESRGRIPPATYRSPMPKGEQLPGKKTQGRRLYTRAQVELIIQAVDKFIGNDPRQRSAKWNEFKKYIKQHWTK